MRNLTISIHQIAFLSGYLDKEAGLKNIASQASKSLRKSPLANKNSLSKLPHKALKYVTNTKQTDKINPLKAAARVATIGPRVLPNNKHDLAVRGALAAGSTYAGASAYKQRDAELKNALQEFDNYSGKVPAGLIPPNLKSIRQELGKGGPLHAFTTDNPDVRNFYSNASALRDASYGDKGDSAINNVPDFFKAINSKKFPESTAAQNPLLNVSNVFDSPLVRLLRNQALKADGYLDSYKKPMGALTQQVKSLVPEKHKTRSTVLGSL
jgi:hypothetical protein